MPKFGGSVFVHAAFWAAEQFENSTHYYILKIYSHEKSGKPQTFIPVPF